MKAPQRIVNQASFEDQSKNGVRVWVFKDRDGNSVVDADCDCFGTIGRVHSNMQCPVYKKANKS
jgi:hypothetical protein